MIRGDKHMMRTWYQHVEDCSGTNTSARNAGGKQTSIKPHSAADVMEEK